MQPIPFLFRLAAAATRVEGDGGATITQSEIVCIAALVEAYYEDNSSLDKLDPFECLAKVHQKAFGTKSGSADGDLLDLAVLLVRVWSVTTDHKEGARGLPRALSYVLSALAGGSSYDGLIDDLKSWILSEEFNTANEKESVDDNGRD